ncbi:MAG: uracil-DNA glycosylase, partial [Clostridia bacterium]|nr:uracil-DNA glycosylase [Clostridia bacterium]
MPETTKKHPLLTEYERCAACAACSLSQGRHNAVYGVGPSDAKIMFVGEGPGEQEDLLGEPFVGRSGRLLDQLLGSVGLSRRENVYICNIVKCRPPNNRNPLPSEQDACMPFLREQVRLVSPKLIICLGLVAAKKLIDPDIRMGADHGVF